MNGDSGGSNQSSRTLLVIGTVVVVLGVVATMLLQKEPTKPPRQPRSPGQGGGSSRPAVKASTAVGVVSYDMARWIYMRIDNDPETRLKPEQVKKAYGIVKEGQPDEHVPELMAVLEGKQADVAREMLEQRDKMGLEGQGTAIGPGEFRRYLQKRESGGEESGWWFRKVSKATTNAFVSSLLGLYDNPRVAPTAEQTATLVSIDKDQSLRGYQRAWTDMLTLLDKTLTDAQKGYIKEHPPTGAEPITDKDVIDYLAGVAKVRADSVPEAPVPATKGVTGTRKKGWRAFVVIMEMQKTPQALTAEQAQALLPLMRLCGRLGESQRQVEHQIWRVLEEPQRKALLDGLDKPETTTVEEFQSQLEAKARK